MKQKFIKVENHTGLELKKGDLVYLDETTGQIRKVHPDYLPWYYKLLVKLKLWMKN